MCCLSWWSICGSCTCRSPWCCYICENTHRTACTHSYLKKTKREHNNLPNVDLLVVITITNIKRESRVFLRWQTMYLHRCCVQLSGNPVCRSRMCLCRWKCSEPHHHLHIETCYSYSHSAWCLQTHRQTQSQFNLDLRALSKYQTIKSKRIISTKTDTGIITNY